MQVQVLSHAQQMRTKMTSDLIDIGVNLAHRRFAADRDAVIARARAAGVSTIVITGTSMQASREARALAAARPGTLWSTAGIHPHDARNATAAALAELRELARDPVVRAICECGLDFDRMFSPREHQERAFAQQLALPRSSACPCSCTSAPRTPGSPPSCASIGPLSPQPSCIASREPPA